MTTSLSERRVITCRQRAVRAVRFNVDGSYCLTAGDDKRVRLWNPHNGLSLAAYAAHADTVLDVRGSCDSSQLVSGGADRSVILWDVSTAAAVRRYRAHSGAVTCVAYNTESTVLLSGSVDNTVMFWDAVSRRQEPVQVLRDARDTVTSLHVSGHLVLAASADGYVRLYDVRMFRLTLDCIGHAVGRASMTRDDQCYILSCADGTIKLIDRDSGELLSTYEGHSGQTDVALEALSDRTDAHIISGSLYGDIFCYNLLSGKCVSRLTHQRGHVVQSISHHPTDDMVLSACGDTIKLWAPPVEEDS